MFNNVSSKLKLSAWIVLGIGVICSLILGIICFVVAGQLNSTVMGIQDFFGTASRGPRPGGIFVLIGILLIIFGTVLSYVLALLVHGYAQIMENSRNGKPEEKEPMKDTLRKAAQFGAYPAALPPQQAYGQPQFRQEPPVAEPPQAPVYGQQPAPAYAPPQAPEYVQPQAPVYQQPQYNPMPAPEAVSAPVPEAEMKAAPEVVSAPASEVEVKTELKSAAEELQKEETAAAEVPVTNEAPAEETPAVEAPVTNEIPAAETAADESPKEEAEQEKKQDTRVCPNCGAEIDAQAVFCKKCGAKVE